MTEVVRSWRRMGVPGQEVAWPPTSGGTQHCRLPSPIPSIR